MRSMVGLAGIVCPRISGESSQNPIGRFAGTSHFHLCVRHAKEARADIKTHAPKGLLIAKSVSSMGQGQHEISATRWLRKTPSSHCWGTCLGLLRVGACRKSWEKMIETDSSSEQQTLIIQQSLELAVRHHNEGRLPEAGSIFQQILQVDPNQPVALHLLGVIAHQVGNYDTAVDLITKAIDIETDYADAHSNLGNALRELGRLDEAMASYHKALAIKPNHAEAHNNLGNVLQDLGKLDEAIATYRNALDINPDYAEALNNMGNALKDLGRLDEAVVSYNKALAIKSDFAEAHNNLANVLKVLGRLDETITSYRNALSIRSDLSGAGRNLLNVMLNVPGMSPKELFDEHLGFTKRFKRHITPIDKHFPNDPTPDRQLRVGYLSSRFPRPSGGRERAAADFFP